MASNKIARINDDIQFVLSRLLRDIKDPRVQQNGGYLSIILLSRVITKLGTLPAISTRVIENLFTVDIAYLQDLYQRINMEDVPTYHVMCPKCGEMHEVPLDFLIEQV